MDQHAFLVQDEALAQQPRQVPRERHEGVAQPQVLRHGHAPGAGSSTACTPAKTSRRPCR